MRLPSLTVDRVGDSYRSPPDGKQLVVKLGGSRQQDFWLFDVATGAKRRHLARPRRIAPALRRLARRHAGIVFERVRENSDIVLIELPERSKENFSGTDLAARTGVLAGARLGRRELRGERADPRRRRASARRPAPELGQMVPVGHRQAPPQEREHRLGVAEQAVHLRAVTGLIGIGQCRRAVPGDHRVCGASLERGHRSQPIPAPSRKPGDDPRRGCRIG